MAHQVFISYSDSDRHVAQAVCHRLEARGIRCWIAPRDVLPGHSWKASIVGAIRRAQAMVLIFSGDANRSIQVQREVDIAFETGHPIVPFRIENVEMNDEIRWCIAQRHWLDALTPPLEAHIDRLADAIHGLVSADTGPQRLVVDGSDEPAHGAGVAPPAGQRSETAGNRLREDGGTGAFRPAAPTGTQPAPTSADALRAEAVRRRALSRDGASTSAVAPERPHAAPGARALPGLRRTSVFLVLLLSMITVGFYAPAWFLARRRSINALHSKARLSEAGAIAAILLLGLYWIGAIGGAVFEEMGALDTGDVLYTFAGLSLFAALAIIIVLAFRVRRIIEDHYEAYFGTPLQISDIATFFFTIFYLQYKINELIDAGATSGTAPPGSPGPPRESAARR